MRRRAEFGPFVVDWPAGALDRVLFALLGGPTESTRPETIRIDVTDIGAPISAPERREAFFLGEVRAFEDDGRIVVCDGYSRATVSADGCRIDLELHAASTALQSPFHTHGAPGMLAVAARARDVFHMHAAVTTFGVEAVLVVGQGHAGKTTVALSLLDAGGRWGGDDLALFEGCDESVRVWGVPRCFHLRPLTSQLFARLSALGDRRTIRGEERVDVNLLEVMPERRLSGPVVPSLVLVPRVVDAPVTTAVWTPGDAVFGELLHASAMIVADELGRQQDQFDLLARIVASTRHAEVRLGRDGLEDGAAASRALARLLDQ